MNRLLFIALFIFINACSFNIDSKYWNEKSDKKNDILGKIVVNSFFEEYLDQEIEKYKNIWCSETSGIEKTSNLKHKILLKLEDGTEIYSKVFALSSTKNQKIIVKLKLQITLKKETPYIHAYSFF